MGALSSFSVLDLSFYAPGRYASMVLGDLGADVLCVEMPRGTRPGYFAALDDDTHARWFWYQRNKRSITLNLKAPGGMEVFRRLAAKVDVVIESYKPGTAERLGVDYAAVKELNPDVVYCSVSGFGQTGPYREMIAHEPNYQGLSGLLGQNQQPGADPAVVPAIVGDIGSGSGNALIAILAALLHRQATGVGQYIDVSITAGIVPFLGLVPHAHWHGDPFRSLSTGSNLRPDFRPYRTKDGKYVSISPIEPWLWERMCKLLGLEELIGVPLTTAENRERVTAALTELFASRTRDEWTALNERENLAITPVWETFEELEQDPQMIHREMIVEVDYEPLGKVRQVGIPFQLSETPAEIRWIPRYGQHTAEVLEEIGYSGAEIDELRHNGVAE